MKENIYALLSDIMATLHVAFPVYFFVITCLLLDDDAYVSKQAINVYIFVMAFGVLVVVPSYIWWRGCPFTIWEQKFRALAGKGIYEGSFIAHYTHKFFGINVNEQLLHFVPPAMLFLLVVGGVLLYRKIAL